jgi:hypothetical protein
MPKRNPVAEISEKFELFIASGDRLPSLPDGKINVTGLCKLLGLRASDAQYFHKSEELKGAVNALCAEQSILKIGHRVQSEEDAATNQRLARIQKQATQDARAATEQSAASEALLQELTAARRLIEDLRLERDGLAERLAIYESGGVSPRI